MAAFRHARCPVTSTNSADADPAHRPVRSFVLRQGRMSPAQQRALDTLLPRLGIAYAAAPLDFAATFGRNAPVILEIGFGMGESTAAIAAAQPQHDFVGL
jgi:tRNA (guanine-N7-)-methyltransferase